MLSRLTFEQISKFWEVIEHSIDGSLPPTVGEVPDKMNNILTALLNGSMQCWVSHKKEEGINKLEGVMTTAVTVDFCSGTKTLLLYSGFGYRGFDRQTWMEGFEAISKYARSIHCNKIAAYSDNSDVIRAADMLGGETRFRLITFDL